MNPDLDLIDIGANLTHKSFRDDLDTVLEAAAGAGVADILITGTSSASPRGRGDGTRARARKSPRLAPAGIHRNRPAGRPAAIAGFRSCASGPRWWP